MTLYHGTNTDFQQIRLDMSRVGKDFGFGFYLTTDKQVATRLKAKEEFFANNIPSHP
jgi:hypothetical protein